MLTFEQYQTIVRRFNAYGTTNLTIHLQEIKAQEPEGYTLTKTGIISELVEQYTGASFEELEACTGIKQDTFCKDFPPSEVGAILSIYQLLYLNFFLANFYSIYQDKILRTASLRCLEHDPAVVNDDCSSPEGSSFFVTGTKPTGKIFSATGSGAGLTKDERPTGLKKSQSFQDRQILRESMLYQTLQKKVKAQLHGRDPATNSVAQFQDIIASGSQTTDERQCLEAFAAKKLLTASCGWGSEDEEFQTNVSKLQKILISIYEENKTFLSWVNRIDRSLMSLVQFPFDSVTTPTRAAPAEFHIPKPVAEPLSMSQVRSNPSPSLTTAQFKTAGTPRQGLTREESFRLAKVMIEKGDISSDELSPEAGSFEEDGLAAAGAGGAEPREDIAAAAAATSLQRGARSYLPQKDALSVHLEASAKPKTALYRGGWKLWAKPAEPPRPPSGASATPSRLKAAAKLHMKHNKF